MTEQLKSAPSHPEETQTSREKDVDSISSQENKFTHSIEENSLTSQKISVTDIGDSTELLSGINDSEDLSPTEQITKLEQYISHLENTVISELAVLRKDISQICSLLEQCTNLQKQTLSQATVATRHASESVWSAIFNNTITHSGWLQNKSFPPGRWAVGYAVLYVMFRILNEMRPKCILELGLGQSTRMIGQYANFFKNIEHVVIEHDKKWIDFFLRDFQLSPSTSLINLDWGETSYKDVEHVRIYEGLSSQVQGKKFELIVIDGPLGGDMKSYSRIDTLLMLPDCLAEDFIILLDDYNRPQEQHTLSEMERILTEHNIAYTRGTYSGDKDLVILTSSSLSFMCSL